MSQGERPAAGDASFWVGYLDDGLSCVPLEVSVSGRRPVRVGLSARGGTCTG
jgi:hypothetical protein